MGYEHLENFIERLKRCGFNISEATRICYDMHKNYGVNGLEEYVRSVEEDCYVDNVQS